MGLGTLDEINRLREENVRLRGYMRPDQIEEAETVAKLIRERDEARAERDAAWAVRDAGWVQTEDALARMRTAEAKSELNGLAQDLCDRVDTEMKGVRLSGESLDECAARLIRERDEARAEVEKERAYADASNQDAIAAEAEVARLEGLILAARERASTPTAGCADASILLDEIMSEVQHKESK